MNRLKSATQLRSFTLVALLALTQLLTGCDGVDEETVAVNGSESGPASGPVVVTQGEHGLTLSEEEVAVLRQREAELSNAWEAALGEVEEGEAAGDAWAAWEALIEPIRANTIGYAWEGRHGELVYSGSEEAKIHIVEVDNGLELLKFDANGFPYYHAVVLSGGEFLLNPATNKYNDTSKAPQYWQTDQLDTNVKSLSKESPVLYAGGMRPKQPANRPKFVIS